MPISPQPSDLSTCSMVALSGTELSNPFALSIANAETIGVSILVAFATAWGIKMIARSFF